MLRVARNAARPPSAAQDRVRCPLLLFTERLPSGGALSLNFERVPRADIRRRAHGRRSAACRDP